jgi:hypothetical protein
MSCKFRWRAREYSLAFPNGAVVHRSLVGQAILCAKVGTSPFTFLPDAAEKRRRIRRERTDMQKSYTFPGWAVGVFEDSSMVGN